VREPAEPSRSAPVPPRPGLAAAVHGLPWLAPGVSSLVSLARPFSGSTWNAIRNDPGAVLLLLRSATNVAPEQLPELLLEPACLELALRHLDDPIFPDWMGIVAAPVYRFAVRAAGLAARLAAVTGTADADAAWICGLLAPLGWMAVCAIDPTAADGCLGDCNHATDPCGTQRRWWGLDQAAIARRLARRWRLPGWLAAGRLALRPDAVSGLGIKPDLFHLTRLAVGLAGRQGPDPGLVDAANVAASAAELGVNLATWSSDGPDAPGGPPREDPKSQPLLRDLLATAAENRRFQATPRHDRLEDEADVLHRALEVTERSQAARLQAEKLTALAEFAAGAGHEINNPLAVILGQAQYLLGHEAEWFAPDPEGEARNALQKIIGQTRRIHGLLRDLMQFARPAPPSPAWHDLPELMGEVAVGLAELAEQRQVTLVVEARPDRLPVFLDAGQAKVALTCLLRNAVEAAPPGGRARLVFHDRSAADTLQVAVEDNGPGPDAALRTSLFDPFFSGRSAGRGRGLGLPTAWRLARQQGGDVHLEPTRPGEPTRFILTLPRVRPPEDFASPQLVESVLAAPLPAQSETAANGCHTS
jgi:two-component system NtrC family sensor kinase